MKILYMVDYYQPQIGYNEYYLPSEWSRLGHDVTILTSDHYYPFPNYEETAGKLLGARRQKPGIYKQDKVTVIKNPMQFEVFTRAVFGGHESIINKIRPDIVIVNKSSSYNSFQAARLKKKYHYKLITYDAHLMSGYNAVGNVAFKDFVYWLYRLTISRYMNKRVDKYIAVQEGTVDVMINLYGQKPVEHIPLGTDPERFRYDITARRETRKKYQIPITASVGIYTGKIIPTKGVSILYEAFGRLAKKNPNLHLLIVGSGGADYIKQCESLVDSKYLKRIHLVGFKETKELYKFYSASDFGVWPLEESTSMNDAAACEIPFIANDEAGVKQRFKNDNALKYLRGDSRDLSVKMEYLINNPKEAKNMGKRGRELILNELSWNKIAKQYLSVIKGDVEQNLSKTLDWLEEAQRVTGDGGVSAYHMIIRGWAPSFIETTGYIISTFLDAAKYKNNKIYLRLAIKMGDFIISNQLGSGGYRTYTKGHVELSEPTIFNTAQDIIGLVDLYLVTKDKKYLNSAQQAANFLISSQNQDGSWTQFTHNSVPKTYHSRVAYALLKLYEINRKVILKKAAIKQLDWVLSRQLKNGFVTNAELPVAKYPFTITHTIAYVAEGLLYSAKILKSLKYQSAALRIIDKVHQHYLSYNELPSYFDQNWKPQEKFGCLTGEAQFAILFMETYKIKNDQSYLSSAYNLINRIGVEMSATGGIPGSRPIYGDLLHNRGYCRLSYINWAAKFTADAEMLFLSIWK